MTDVGRMQAGTADLAQGPPQFRELIFRAEARTGGGR